ncbi:ADP-ribosylglycohydrolase family protein [Pseudobacteriovorax antillogorgiicola]|uniref:ADP-ribosylglycohydrolase n=1 Tax=Pseudobacteriovorax antillogorgiicola TaxID=1513793 RepID=A0A1Y6C4D8_9BACT|nr:ADP-ribosylglycohydrolase family protein [Pseudobacteriovorax antillogorgiicola]TCS49836.1 ADP-ribosylglycohydrolase [Pseudobacteriovorax antillogorgiicola]SMF43430.1 ADP-ribosylglycohydrolase [Pseudobacteriovorax antillogorgiicola]
MKYFWYSCITASVLSWLSPSVQATSKETSSLRISEAEYQEKVLASWLGQIVGNIYGLSYEFAFIDEPGPDQFPYGYGSSLERVRRYNGAFSDDDTDIEYIYLLAMEKHGTTPRYEDLSKFWTYHIREKVWAANRMALNLMKIGYHPPLTGSEQLNSEWFQIDPQLINEIWAVTSPGMITYASQKSAWAARITNDRFGIEPTIHYGAMYAAAFFEDDVNQLIEIGLQALPGNSRFRETVEYAKQLYRQYPEDWQEARRRIADRYYKNFDYNPESWAALDANLNGACGILALLYGQGDFQKTLDYASGMGFDADNQAATMSGLLGIIHGLKGIPQELLYPLGEQIWSQPFNDQYVNISRYDLPDATISDMALRTAQQGLKVIQKSGGRIIQEKGQRYLEINPGARFIPPLELPAVPPIHVEAFKEFSKAIATHLENTPSYLIRGQLPAGLRFEQGRLLGTPTQLGHFQFTLEARQGKQAAQRDYQIEVHSHNLAPLASSLSISENDLENPGQDIDILRDGKLWNTFYSTNRQESPKTDIYELRWDQSQEIGSFMFRYGRIQEWGGWFTSFDLQYLGAKGQWLSVPGVQWLTPINFDNSPWLKGQFVDHWLRFPLIKTKGLRIVGQAGGLEKDPANQHLGLRYYTNLSEIAVFKH